MSTQATEGRRKLGYPLLQSGCTLPSIPAGLYLPATGTAQARLPFGFLRVTKRMGGGESHAKVLKNQTHTKKQKQNSIIGPFGFERSPNV
jgi:hypothetical protein